MSLKNCYNYSFPVFDHDISSMLVFALMQVPKGDYTPYLDVSPDISGRIRRHLYAYENFHQFATLLKTKELTYSRICRCLIHILLDIKKSDLTAAKRISYVPYFRVSGIRKESTILLKEIKKHSDIPIITNPAHLPDTLSEEGRRMMELDVKAAHIYNAIAGQKFGHAVACEYTQHFLKV